MSGTFVGVVDCRLTSFANGNQEGFVNLYTFMQRHVTVGNATLHASNFGSGGTGFDYHDGANPSGENAWAVFKFLASASSLRTTDFYVLIQWADVSSFGASPGNPGSLQNGTGDGVGYMMAYREDNGDPWNGTINADGTDTKGTPVWAGTGLHVMSAYNETGVRSTNKEDLTYLCDVGSSSSRISMVGDADSMWFAHDDTNDSLPDSIFYMGVYTPRSDIVVPNPYILTGNIEGALDASSHIDTGEQTGVIAVDQSRGVKRIRVHSRYTWASYAENFGAGMKFVSLPMLISKTSTEDGVEYGLLGHLRTDIIRQTDGRFQTNAVNSDYSRVFMANTSDTSIQRYSLRWGVTHTPGTVPTRDGVVF